MSKPIILLGGGGHASVLMDIMIRQKHNVIAVVTPDAPKYRILNALLHLARDADVLNYSPDDVLLVNGIGSLPNSRVRFKVFDYFKSEGYFFKTIVAADAYVSEYAQLDEGVQIMPGAIVQTGVHIGEDTIVNTGAIIDHDCRIGRHNHIATGACLSGQVQTGFGVHIGTGASVIQSISLGNDSVVGAGAVVNKNVADNMTVYPAKVFIK